MARSKGKLSKGQPRGNRSASGRLRNRTPLRLEPCDGVQRRRALYRLPVTDVGDDSDDRTQRRGRPETDTCDALGRAYCAGLLGSGEKAKDMLVAGRRIAAQYWRIYGFPTPDSLARFQPQNPSLPGDPEQEKAREMDLNAKLAAVRKAGHDVRRAFDQLVIDIHPDSGPPWLDAIVWAKRHDHAPANRDVSLLETALRGLAEIA